MQRTATLLLPLLIASAALAHEGVKDPKVKAWMGGMTTISQNTKTLTQMARSQIPYDKPKADAAIAAMSAEARRIPALFEVKASDPKSEARADIWDNWDTFQKHSRDLEAALGAADTSSAAAIGASLRDIGTPCRACHEEFRQRN